jgi:hypothetical protein
MRNDEEAMKNSKGQRGHGEEFHRRNSFPMIAQEGRPSLRGSGFRGAFRIQRNTVCSETSNPSIINSP